MLRNVSAAICLIAAISGVAVAAPTENPKAKWQPVGKWVVDFADQQCTAGRQFQSGAINVNLNFRPRPTSPTVLVVVEAPRGRQALGIFKAKFDFGQGWQDLDGLLTLASTKAGFVIYSFGTDRDGWAQLESSQRLRLDAARLKLDLPVTALTAVIKVVDQCVADLLKDWGLSQQDQARLASFPVPRGNLTSVVHNADYPSSALARDAYGIVEARVTVSPAGKASDCHMIRSSGHDDLDKATCKVVVTRARFEPARDRQGQAMASPYAFEIRWLIPKI